MLTNDRIRCAQGWCQYRDLGGALCATSDGPIPELNALRDFTTDDDRIEGMLDIGFALLRAFDCPPAAEITPLDRPPSLERRLRDRTLVQRSARTWMRFAGDEVAIRTNPDVRIRIAGLDDIPAFAQVHGGSDRWVRRTSQQSTLTAMHDGGSTFYIAYLDGQPAGRCTCSSMAPRRASTPSAPCARSGATASARRSSPAPSPMPARRHAMLSASALRRAATPSASSPASASSPEFHSTFWQLVEPLPDPVAPRRRRKPRAQPS